MAQNKFMLLLLICGAVATAEPLMNVVHSWVYVDYLFSDPKQRDMALEFGDFIPENCVILDVDVWQDSPTERIFVTVPRIKPGNPASLNELIVPGNEGGTALLAPFPNWDANTVLDVFNINCDDTIISVFRTKIDDFGRFWVVDVGTLDQFEPTARLVCPPKLLIFDLKRNDTKIKSYSFPLTQVKNSLFSNIVVDVRDPEGQNTFAYISDTTAYKLIVYDYKNDDSWVVDQAYFYPYPTQAHFVVNGVNFAFADGVLGLALGPVVNNDRTLYFHSFSSIRESWVSCKVLQNKTMFANGFVDGSGVFFVSPEARKIQSTAEVMTVDGILIFTSMDNSLVSWNSQDEFITENLRCVYKNDVEFQFPTCVKIVGDKIWAVSSQLQNQLSTKPIDKKAIKYRVLVGKVGTLINGIGCDLLA